ncbi:STAS domain-containing protein [Actinoplanes sp. NPDC051411]|uniref:STAS domain-containing protein n=1 Tax=unclassified Actinoplanes TaxID=2626549 RepID=UPI00343C60D6
MSLLINTHRIPEQAMTIAIEPQGAIGPEDASLLSDRFIMVLAATEPDRIVVDLSAVPAISDAGLEALQSGCRKATANDATVVVVDAAPQVEQQLRRHGLNGLVGGGHASDGR